MGQHLQTCGQKTVQWKPGSHKPRYSQPAAHSAPAAELPEVRQESVFGPLLWNVMYDGILKLHLPTGCNVVGFTDYIAMVGVAKECEEVERAAIEAIKILEP